MTTTTSLTKPPTLTHPDARCGFCAECHHVQLTRQIVLAHSAPAGPGITDREADLWNTTLTNNPCQQPLVVVTLRTPAMIQARLLKDLGGDKESIQVMTVAYGPVYVDRDQVEAWTPERCLDGISFEHLKAALMSMPMTWYPALLDALARGAHAKNTFLPFGASTSVRRIEVELLGPDLQASQFSGYMAARASMKALELKTVLGDLLNTTDLNLDEMDPDTRTTIDRAQALIREIETGK